MRETQVAYLSMFTICLSSLYFTRSRWLGKLVTVVTVRSVTEAMFVERAQGLLKIARRVKHVLCIYLRFSLSTRGCGFLYLPNSKNIRTQGPYARDFVAMGTKLMKLGL